jgi:hypothetical protein
MGPSNGNRSEGEQGPVYVQSQGQFARFAVRTR